MLGSLLLMCDSTHPLLRSLSEMVKHNCCRLVLKNSDANPLCVLRSMTVKSRNDPGFAGASQ